ncbi:MAG: hypothetical protein NZ809_01645 [Thermodesulfovibrio sp.]|nr:hypothetical protein [Thermodesulfovibrio sp.]
MGFSIATDFPPKFLIANKGFKEILGSDEKEINLIEQIHETDRDLFINSYNSILNRQQKKMNERIKFIRKNNNLVCLRVVMTPTKFMDLDSVKICFTDITESWLKEQEMEELQKQLLFAQKMESIGRLVAGIAHDFNNILTAIKGFIYLAQIKTIEDDPLKKYLDNIQLAAERAEKLVRQLLAFSRKQLLQPKAINLNDLVKNLTYKT